MRITVKIDDRQFRAALNELRPAQVKAAAVIAVNETARGAQAFSARLIAKEMGMKVADVRKLIRVYKAKRGNAVAVISPSMS